MADDTNERQHEAWLADQADAASKDAMCKHYACRCARAAELAQMAERTGRTELLVDAVAVHSQRVQCRAIEP
jgi:hypothetical protein